MRGHKTVDPAGSLRRSEQVALAVDHPEEAAAVVEPVEWKAGGEAQLGEAEVAAVGVLANEEGVAGACRGSCRSGRA